MTEINFSILESDFVFIWIKEKIMAINAEGRKRKEIKKRDHNLIITKKKVKP